MKQAGYTKRPYTRSTERSRPLSTRQSNGPSSNEGKIRGNPQQSVEKYLTLARDATALGDPISAENYYQYADHYYRLVVASRPVRTPHVERRVEESASLRQPEPVVEKATSVASQGEHWLE